MAILGTSHKADERHEADWQTVAASLAFVEEQNAGADCLPCIRLLSGGCALNNTSGCFLPLEENALWCVGCRPPEPWNHPELQ